MSSYWEDEKENLRKLYVEEGLNQTELGKRYGCTQRQMSNILKSLGIIRTEEDKLRLSKLKNPHLVRRCECCGKEFYAAGLKVGKYCSSECAHEVLKKVPDKDTLLKQLEENDWNYTAVGKLNGVSDNAIKKNAVKFGIYFPKQKSWSDVNDLESAQKKIDELGVKTATDLHENYGGLADRIGRLNLTSELVYPVSEFDSSWEESIFNLVKDNITYTNLSHNIVLDPECRYERPLIFDIVIEYSEYSKTVIEIQGVTHFKPVFNDEKFDTIRERDEIKYNYCISNNINILYFTYEPKLVEKYGYPHYIYTDENLLLDKLRELSLPSN